MKQITINNIPINVKLARTPKEKVRGLMDFQGADPNKLKPNEGMLFVYSEEEMLSFWMKRTSIPLQIAFIGADKRIQQIEDLEPHNEVAVKSKKPAQYALEVNRGWFDNNNIKVGDLVTIPNSRVIKIRLLK